MTASRRLVLYQDTSRQSFELGGLWTNSPWVRELFPGIWSAISPAVHKANKGRKEMFYLTTHSTHFIYCLYMGSDIWLRIIPIVRKETCCREIGYSFRLTARVLLYAPSHRQDSTYQGLCYTSRRALAGTRNSSMGPPHEGLIRRPIAPWANALTTELHLAPNKGKENFNIYSFIFYYTFFNLIFFFYVLFYYYLFIYFHLFIIIYCYSF